MQPNKEGEHAGIMRSVPKIGKKNAYPIGRTEIDGFGEIVALIESGVISSRKRYDEFAGALIDRVNLKMGKIQK